MDSPGLQSTFEDNCWKNSFESKMLYIGQKKGKFQILHVTKIWNLIFLTLIKNLVYSFIVTISGRQILSMVTELQLFLVTELVEVTRFELVEVA